METTKSCARWKAMLFGEWEEKSLPSRWREEGTPFLSIFHTSQLGLTSFCCRSTVEGYAKFAPENSKWTKHTVAQHIAIGGNGPIMVGTPSQVVDQLQTWVDEADVDGFNFVSQTCQPKNFSLGKMKALTGDYQRHTHFSPTPSRTLSISCCPSSSRGICSGMAMRSKVAHTVRTSTIVRVKRCLWMSTWLQNTIGRPGCLLVNMLFPSECQSYKYGIELLGIKDEAATASVGRGQPHGPPQRSRDLIALVWNTSSHGESLQVSSSGTQYVNARSVCRTME